MQLLPTDTDYERREIIDNLQRLLEQGYKVELHAAHTEQDDPDPGTIDASYCVSVRKAGEPFRSFTEVSLVDTLSGVMEQVK